MFWRIKNREPFSVVNAFANGFEIVQVWQRPHAGSGHPNCAVPESWKWAAAISVKFLLKISIEVLRIREDGGPGRKELDNRRYIDLGNFFLFYLLQWKKFLMFLNCSWAWAMFPFKTFLTCVRTLVLNWVLFVWKTAIRHSPLSQESDNQYCGVMMCSLSLGFIWTSWIPQNKSGFSVLLCQEIKTFLTCNTIFLRIRSSYCAKDTLFKAIEWSNS